MHNPIQRFGVSIERLVAGVHSLRTVVIERGFRLLLEIDKVLVTLVLLAAAATSTWALASLGFGLVQEELRRHGAPAVPQPSTSPILLDDFLSEVEDYRDALVDLIPAGARFERMLRPGLASYRTDPEAEPGRVPDRLLLLLAPRGRTASAPVAHPPDPTRRWRVWVVGLVEIVDAAGIRGHLPLVRFVDYSR